MAQPDDLVVEADHHPGPREIRAAQPAADRQLLALQVALEGDRLEDARVADRGLRGVRRRLRLPAGLEDEDERDDPADQPDEQPRPDRPRDGGADQPACGASAGCAAAFSVVTSASAAGSPGSGRTSSPPSGFDERDLQPVRPARQPPRDRQPEDVGARLDREPAPRDHGPLPSPGRAAPTSLGSRAASRRRRRAATAAVDPHPRESRGQRAGLGRAGDRRAGRPVADRVGRVDRERVLVTADQVGEGVRRARRVAGGRVVQVDPVTGDGDVVLRGRPGDLDAGACLRRDGSSRPDCSAGSCRDRRAP